MPISPSAGLTQGISTLQEKVDRGLAMCLGTECMGTDQSWIFQQCCGMFFGMFFGMFCDNEAFHAFS